MITICPRCHAKDGFKKVEIEKDDSGGLILFIGGVLAYFIHRASRQDKIQCKQCDLIFSIPRSKFEVFMRSMALFAISTLIIYWVYLILR